MCAEPELAIRNLMPANPFFLIGSDGIFEFMPSQTVVDMVRHALSCTSTRIASTDRVASHVLTQSCAHDSLHSLVLMKAFIA